MNDKERAELEYYRQMYGQTAPDQEPSAPEFGAGGGPGLQPHYASPYGPPPAQDALSVEEQMAFWPDELDYHPKYQIAERHRQVYGSWPKQGQQ